MDCSLPGSSVHEIFPATTLEWVAIFFSRGSTQPRDPTHVSCTRRQLLYHWATREAQKAPVQQYFCCLDVYVWGQYSLLVHFTAGGYLGYFQCFIIINNAANAHTQVYLKEK